MLKRGIGIFIAIFFAANASATVPEGLGNLELEMGYSPGRAMESGYSGNAVGASAIYQLGSSWQERMDVDFPVWSGLSMGLGAQSRQASATWQGTGGLNHDQSVAEKPLSYQFNADLRLYPASFMGIPFRPGENANPDGWYGWPSFSLIYSTSNLDDFSTVSFSGSYPSRYEEDYFIFDQSFGYGLVLPMAPWLSINGSYGRNSELDIDASEVYPYTKMHRGGAYESESVGLAFYINMLCGADEDSSRPFVPYLGRVGQLKVGMAWSRCLYLLVPGSGLYQYYDPAELFTFLPLQSVQTYTLTVGAPLTGNLGVTLAADVVQPDHLGGYWGLQNSADFIDNRDTMDFFAKLSWAFGKPEFRVGSESIPGIHR